MSIILGRPAPGLPTHDHDHHYYDKDQVDTISGSLQSDIDSKASIIHDHLSANISDFDEASQDAVGTIMVGKGSILVTYNDLVPSITISGATVASGVVTDHDLLTNLDFEGSGHTGFASTEELTTVSGNIVSQIPNLDGYATEFYVTTVSGDIISQIPIDYVSDSEMVTISGDIMAQMPTDYASEEYVDTISGALNDKIEDLEVKSVEEFTLTSTNIINRYITLFNAPKTSSEVIAWVDGGTHGLYNVDYVIANETQISWNSKNWESVLEEGDVLTVLYWY